MMHYRLDVTLTLLGPILTRGGTTPEAGIDAPLARDGVGRPMLPFSLVKGKVRDAFHDLPHTSGFVEDWLGKGGNDEYFDQRGRLRFSDFVTEEAGKTNDDLIERIEIDRATGSTAGRMLAMVEAPFGYGQPVPFQGTVEFIAGDDAVAAKVRDALDQAFRWVPTYGGLRTVGFGRTYCVQTKLVTCPTRCRGTPTGASSLPLRLRLDRPLCLVGRRHSGNHFESLETISGAVLKGAAARLILEMSGSPAKWLDPRARNSPWPFLWKHFEAIRFAEARPMTEGALHRPVEPPLSIVTSPTGLNQYFDVALEPEPRLIGGTAPAFAPDWKDEDFALVRGAFGWPTLPRERRTRTAIDARTGRAKDEALFSYGLVRPESKGDDGTIASYVWEASIGLEDIDANDRPAVIKELADLLTYGLPGIGKTRATADVDWVSASTPPQQPKVPLVGAEHVVTLQTEFLMTDPETLTGGIPADRLKRAYHDFWHEASNGAFALVRYFARQALYGGFLSRRSGQTRYEAFLATERGSTFVLKALSPVEAASALQTWRERGLPAPEWVKRRYGNGTDPLWRTCPFLPHAGFGEVAIDLECHTKKRPPRLQP
ncbi:MAG: hypothetical protein P4L84_23225 [Isosphaeraceae bacterium]|nr:hypothetical protein [Isosphaeraceae bacterium]